MYPSKNIIENTVNSADHSTLVAAVKVAGFVETLMDDGPFTVFAPTNAAFDTLPAGTVDSLLMAENKDTLAKILTCHVVAAEAMSSAIRQMIDDDGGTHVVPTVGGCTLQVQYSDSGISIRDENGNVANITIADVQQSNGVIHVIDAVLLPKILRSKFLPEPFKQRLPPGLYPAGMTTLASFGAGVFLLCGTSVIRSRHQLKLKLCSVISCEHVQCGARYLLHADRCHAAFFIVRISTFPAVTGCQRVA